MENRVALSALISIFLAAIMGTASASHLALQNGVVVMTVNTTPSVCTSSVGSLYNGYSQAVNASSATNCEVGVGISNTVGMYPLYMIVPSFAGLTIYGQNSWSSSNGFPVYNGQTVVTDCAASRSQSPCNATSAKAYYSPGIATLETSIGITNGTFGYPQGVLQNAARDYVFPSVVGSNSITSMYVVRIGVYDPNIFPNATTGLCHQWVASNQTSPLANCLNNTAAISRALNTADSAVAAANAKNPIYLAKGGSSPYQAILSLYNATETQIRLGGPYNTTITSTTSKNASTSNTNVVKMAEVVPVQQPAPTTTIATTTVTISNPTTVAPTTIPPTTPPAQQLGAGNTTLYIIAAVILVIAAAYYAFVMPKPKAKGTVKGTRK